MNNLYLVVARCGSDDVPMKLFESHQKALEYAASLTAPEVKGRSLAVFGVEPTLFCAVDLVLFQDGFPGRSVKHHDVPVEGEVPEAVREEEKPVLSLYRPPPEETEVAASAE